MEDKRIKDYQISSSSDWDFDHRPQYARLNQPGPKQWCAHWNKHGTDQFIRVSKEKLNLSIDINENQSRAMSSSTDGLQCP